MKLSVIVCSHNPNLRIFNLVINSLKCQTLNISNWELIIIDNSSDVKISSSLDLNWHSNSKIIIENKLGLVNARLTGVIECSFNNIVFVDDDNILANNYLEISKDFFETRANIGCFGGKSIPQFETQPPEWFFESGINLGCQDYGDELYISNYKEVNYNIQEYPQKSPIGTGMAIRKEAFLSYMSEVKSNDKSITLGRIGKKLTSGEDNDIILTIIKKGYEIAYVPTLVVTHFIPKKRYNLSYLKKMGFESNRSWVKALSLHGISPWKATNKNIYIFRCLKAYFIQKAWKSPLHEIRYACAKGILKGQTEI